MNRRDFLMSTTTFLLPAAISRATSIGDRKCADFNSGFNAMVQAPSESLAPKASYHLKTQVQQRVSALLASTITSSGSALGGHLKCYAIVPPSTETQQLVKCSFRCKELPSLTPVIVKDTRDPKRTYLLLDIPLVQNPTVKPLHFEITYVLDLLSVQVMTDPGSPAAGRPLASADNSEATEDLKPSLASTPTIDFDTDAFQGYLLKNDLFRHSGESVVEFAYRAYRTIGKELAERTRPNKPVGFNNLKASIICGPSCQDDGCGICATMFTATMRANKIASRLLVGRWAKDQDPGGYGQFHVRSDFYDASVGTSGKPIGWVPVDETFCMIQTKLPNGNPNIDFGLNRGDFITFHVNSDLALANAIPLAQSPILSIPMHQFQITAYDGPDWPNYRPQFEPEIWHVTNVTK